MGNKTISKLRNSDIEHYQLKTSFSHAEIQEWHTSFYRDCPSGQLTRDEFKKIYAHFFPRGDSSHFADHVFRHFDSDQNQYISFEEFLTGLSIISKGSLDEKLNWAFGLYDTNGDGYITKEEMLEIVTAIYKMIGNVTTMPEDESTPDKRTDKIFLMFDLDHDGKLSREEFVRGSYLFIEYSDPKFILR